MQPLRSALFVAWMYGLMVVMGVLFAPSLVGPRAWARGGFALWRRLVFWGLRVFGGVTWELRGAEHVPAGGALIACKHQSMFDTLAPWEFLPDPAIILKKELKWLPFFGWWAQKLENVAVDRSAGSRALREMTRQAGALAADGRQVLIFPEGTRAALGEDLAFKPGVAALYAAMDVPCVPVALNSGLVWQSFGVLKRPGRIIVEVLEPIPPGLDRKTFMARLKHAIDARTRALVEEGA